jgi:membrane protein DedA with SNARE-associated domain
MAAEASMFEWLREIEPFVRRVVRDYGVPGIAVLSFVEEVFPPAPSQVVLPLAGFLVGRGEIGFWEAWLASIIGTLPGALVFYQVGVTSERRVIRRFIRRWGRWIGVREGDFDRALANFDRHAGYFVFWCRVIALPPVRISVAIVAGMSAFKRGRFIFLTTLGVGAWHAIVLVAGAYFGRHWNTILDAMEPFETPTVLGLLLLMVVGVYWLVRRGREDEEVVEEES